MPAELVNMDRPADMKDHIGGIQSKVYFAPRSWFSLIAGFKTWAAAGDLAKIDGPHTFTAGKGFITLEGDFKSNTFEGETVGAWGSNNKKFTVKAKYHGTGPEAAEIEALLNNAEGVVLTKRLTADAAPITNQFGLDQMPVRCSGVKWTSGTPESGEAGLELTFEAIQPRLAFYTGVITEKP